MTIRSLVLTIASILAATACLRSHWRRRDRPRQTRSVSAPAIAYVRARARAPCRPATASHSIPSVTRAFSRLLLSSKAVALGLRWV
jgi:hypothetical protein